MIRKFIIKYYCNSLGIYYWEENYNKDRMSIRVKELLNKGTKMEDIKVWEVDPMTIDIEVKK